MERKTTIARKVGIVATVMLLVLLVVGAITRSNVSAIIEGVKLEARYERRLRLLAALHYNLVLAEKQAAMYVLTGDPAFERAWRHLQDDTATQLRDFQRLLGPEGNLEIPRLNRVVGERQKQLAQVVSLAQQGDRVGAVAALSATSETHAVILDLRARYRAIVEELEGDADRRRAAIVLTIGLEVTLALLFVYLVGRFAILNLTLPLAKLVAGIEHLRAGRLDYRVEVKTHDEVGQLGRAFNRMAEDLEQGRKRALEAENALLQTNDELAMRVEELRRRNLEIQEMSKLTELLQTALKAEEAYEVVAGFGQRIFPGTAGTLLLANPSRSFLEAVTGWGEPRTERVFASEECWALRRGRPHAALEEGSLICHHFGSGTGAALCLPLVAQGDALGVLCLEGGAIDEQLAVTVSEQLSLALANLRLRETLRNQSIRDALTGLFNRRFLEESLERELHRARRNDHPLGVLMIDIDHFKRFNDDFGHEAGDAVLQALGELLRTSVRGEDVPCRYGGEEFALLLPGAGLEVAMARAEKLRQAASEMTVVSGGRTLGTVTLSVGVAAFPMHGQDGAEVIRVADAALYRAKRAGRNQVQTGPGKEEPRSEPVEGRSSGASLS